MSTEAYKKWVEKGRPWSKAKPIAHIEKWARANGVKVLGTIGNNAHLTSNRPQDHTPFSSTAWPDPLPGYIVTAIDLAPAAGLGEAVLAAARAGKLPWLKYMNYDGKHYEHGDGFKKGTSSKDEHLHLSQRTDYLNAELAADWINVKPGKPSTGGGSKPAPGTPVDFPLPERHWFGADDGSDRSHSGLHGRKTGGKLDSTWIKAWADQLKARGWPIGKGKKWLNRFGNDGKFGDEYEALARAFQRDQGLAADAKIGPDTWNAPYRNPVT